METSLIPLDAEKPRLLHALVRKRAELAGLIEYKRGALQEKVAELQHVDATIRLFNEGLDVGAIRPKSVPRRQPAFKGVITRHVFDALREADEGLTCREITQQVVIARGLDPDDYDTFQIILKRVRANLRDQRNRGVLTSTMLPDGSLVWQVAPLDAPCRISDSRKVKGAD